MNGEQAELVWITAHTWPWCNYCRCYGCPHTDPPVTVTTTSNNFTAARPSVTGTE